jgi:hypothetical protein
LGPDGQLTRASTQLILVDGLNFTITSTASLTTGGLSNVHGNIEGWFLPFFATTGSETANATVNQADEAGLNITVSLNRGNPLVLGLTVEPAFSFANRRARPPDAHHRHMEHGRRQRPEMAQYRQVLHDQRRSRRHLPTGVRGPTGQRQRYAGRAGDHQQPER